MPGSNSRSGWITFAGWLLIVLGAVDVLEGLIAVARQHYYLLTPTQIIVFDLKTWGWITLIWGVVIGLAGLGLLTGNAIARWFAIVIVSLNVLEQLGFVGNSAYPLWALTSIALSGVVIYALIVRWDEGQTAAS
jgi:hypothetical protein